jgi:hypothetical protein
VLYRTSAFALGEGASVILENVITNCPKGHAARFLDGAYTVKDNILNLAGTSPETLRVMRGIAEQAVAGKIGTREAAAKIIDLAPSLAPIFEANASKLLPYLALLVYLIIEITKAASGGDRVVIENHTTIIREVIEFTDDQQLSKRQKRRLEGKAKSKRRSGDRSI